MFNLTFKYISKCYYIESLKVKFQNCYTKYTLLVTTIASIELKIHKKKCFVNVCLDQKKQVKMCLSSGCLIIYGKA